MIRPMSEGSDKHSPYTGVSQFIATGGKIRLFSDGKEAKPTDKVVYVDGAFDLFHAAHINVLEKARALGDFLIVGVHDDQSVNSYKGVNFPIMNLYERVLSVLSCKYTDEVVIGAPLKMDRQFIERLNIRVVVHGKAPVAACPDGSDPYEVPRALGLCQEVDSGSDLTTTVIIDRVGKNWQLYEARNKKKENKEIALMASVEQNKKATGK